MKWQFVTLLCFYIIKGIFQRRFYMGGISIDKNSRQECNPTPRADAVVKNLKLLKIKLCTGSALGAEVYSDNYGYTGNSWRIQTKALDATLPTFGDNKWAVKAMPMLNIYAKNNKSEQLRLTTCLPTVLLGKMGKVNFLGRLENRTTLKFDNNFNRTDIAQEPRIVLTAKKGSWEMNAVLREKFSQVKPKSTEAVLTLQKTFGKVVTYADMYIAARTSYALGIMVPLNAITKKVKKG